jgi:hypothetical protein
MKKQRGAISGAVIGLIVMVVFFLFVTMVVAGSYISAANYGNATEQSLKATKESNRNIFATYGQKVQEAAQVPGMMAEDLQKITTAAIQGRYGDNGSQAAVQWIREQNPQLDPSLYRKIQQIIESGRDEFKNGQNRQIDVKRSYETALGSFWQGMWLKFAGYPKINLDDYKIISTERADDVYRKGKEDGPIKLR